MPIDSELLEVLCCPETHQALELAKPELVAQLNRQLAAGTLKNRSGQTVSEALESGLVRADQHFLYPVTAGIPILLIGEAIPLAQLNSCI